MTIADTQVETLAGFKVEDHVGFLLRRAHQRHVALFTAAVAHAELTPTQFTALLKTAQLGRITQNHLGRLAAMDPATIQGVVAAADRPWVDTPRARSDGPKDRGAGADRDGRCVDYQRRGMRLAGARGRVGAAVSRGAGGAFRPAAQNGLRP